MDLEITNRNRPDSLAELSEAVVVINLLNICSDLNKLYSEQTDEEIFEYARINHRPFWCTFVPSAVRRSLLQKCLSNVFKAIPDNYSSFFMHKNVPACLLHILLDNGIKDLRINLCCYGECDQKTAVLKQLANDGKGLVSLELRRSYMDSLDGRLFQSIVYSSTNLTSLTLINIACDNILRIIGESFLRLVSIDVSQSSNVTDDGIRSLLNISTDDPINVQTHWREAGKNTMFSDATCLDSTVGLFVSSYSTLFLKNCRNPTKLCLSLQSLNLAETSVTKDGILIALSNIRNLRTLGENYRVGNAIQLLEKSTLTTPILSLTVVYAQGTISSELLMISNTCRQLEKLVISTPLHSPHILISLPPTLTSLNLQSVSSEPMWLHGLYKFLSGPQSRFLQDLRLHFTTKVRGIMETMDLGLFFFRLVGLKTLMIEGIILTLQSIHIAIKLVNLEKISLYKIDNLHTLKTLLKYLPRLEVLHVASCGGLNRKYVLDLFSYNSIGNKAEVSEILKCVFIGILHDGDVHMAKFVMNTCKQINLFGNVCGWNLKEVDIKELYTWIDQHNFKQIELTNDDHWYESNCFKE